SEKEKVKLFSVELLTVQKSVLDAEVLLLGKTFDAAIFYEKTNQVTVFRERYETQLGKVSSLKSEISRLISEFKTKANLLVEFTSLSSRATNLGVLATMFNASGFVNYVSSIYLQNLGDM